MKIFTIDIRPYNPSDCKEIIQLFQDTVHTVAKADYTEKQLKAWAPKNIDPSLWNASFLEQYTLITTIDNTIVGVGSITSEGYLDKLYVHKDFQGRKIASLLVDSLESYAIKKRLNKITTHASKTALAFFLKREYKTIKE